MTDTARIGVIGAGWWAVVNHIPVLQQTENCEVVAVNRLGADELSQVMQQFDIEQGFEDYREMLDSVELDGVVICPICCMGLIQDPSRGLTELLFIRRMKRTLMV